MCARRVAFSTVADAVAELIEGAIIVGHNVRKFDMAMLGGRVPPA